MRALGLILGVVSLLFAACDPGSDTLSSSEGHTEQAASNGDMPAPQRVGGPQAHELVEAGALLLDVRTPREFNSGHIDGAINIPINALSRNYDDLRAQDTGNGIVIYCLSGARSAEAMRMLDREGFGPLYDLGRVSAW